MLTRLQIFGSNILCNAQSQYNIYNSYACFGLTTFPTISCILIISIIHNNQNFTLFFIPLYNKKLYFYYPFAYYMMRQTNQIFKDRDTSIAMASHQNRLQKKNATGAFFFFMATLIMWTVSVFFEILFNKRTELIPLLAGFCLYQFANWVCRNFISRDPLLVNTCVSLLHSSLTSASVVFILVKQLMSNGFDELFEHSQLVYTTWPWAYSALCISCGYFAYDQLDMLLYGLYSGWIPSVLLHHFILLGCFTLALYRNVTINYLILTLICELHSIFLHVRKVRRMAGFRDGNSMFVKLEWFFNMSTFFLARFSSHVLITIKLVKDASKFEKGVELPLALFGMAGMNLLNVFLGLDLFNAFRREINRQNVHKS